MKFKLWGYAYDVNPVKFKLWGLPYKIVKFQTEWLKLESKVPNIRTWPWNHHYYIPLALGVLSVNPNSKLEFSFIPNVK